MKEDFINHTLLLLGPYIMPGKADDVKMVLYMASSDYEITKAETSLIIYEGDVNQQILHRFLMAKIAKGLSKRSIAFYKQEVTKALLKIGKPYDQITPDDLRVYFANRVYVDGVSKRCANNERRCLSSFYGWLQTEEILLRNPMTKVDAMKETKSQKHAFSQMEVEKLRSECKTSMELAVFEILVSTWARVSEVAGIKISDISGNQILVHGKGDKDRLVYLTPRAQLAVERYLQDRSDDNPYLFPRAAYSGNVAAFTKGYSRQLQREWYKVPELVAADKHRDAGSIESSIRKIGKKAGVDNTHPHRFRRTGATMALKAGMPITKVSKLLGHESIETTQIYLDVSDADLKGAHEQFVY